MFLCQSSLTACTYVSGNLYIATDVMKNIVVVNKYWPLQTYHQEK
jgi:hypothetical protein